MVVSFQRCVLVFCFETKQTKVKIAKMVENNAERNFQPFLLSLNSVNYLILTSMSINTDYKPKKPFTDKDKRTSVLLLTDSFVKSRFPERFKNEFSATEEFASPELL